MSDACEVTNGAPLPFLAEVEVAPLPVPAEGERREAPLLGDEEDEEPPLAAAAAAEDRTLPARSVASLLDAGGLTNAELFMSAGRARLLTASAVRVGAALMGGSLEGVLVVAAALERSAWEGRALTLRVSGSLVEPRGVTMKANL